MAYGQLLCRREYALPADFVDEEIDEDEAFGEDDDDIAEEYQRKITKTKGLNYEFQI